MKNSEDTRIILAWPSFDKLNLTDGGASKPSIEVPALASVQASTVVDVRASKREAASLTGEAASLTGETASLLRDKASAPGEAASLKGEVASFMREAASFNGDGASLRRDVASRARESVKQPVLAGIYQGSVVAVGAGEVLVEVVAGVGIGGLHDAFGGACGDDVAAEFAAFGAEVYDVVRRLDDIQVVLDDEE
jgi:hypothetical protein